MNGELDNFDPEEWPFFWITQASGRYLRKLELGLKPIGLDVSRWRVLMSARPDRATSTSTIANLAIVKLPTMVKILKRMQADGLVTCNARPADGRVTDVMLTAAGLDARRAAWTVAQSILHTAFDGIPAADQARLNVVLKDIFGRLA